MKLSFKEKTSRILELYLDDEKVGTVDKMLFSRKLASWDVISKEEFLERFLALEYKVALNLTLRRLAMKSLHSQELASILQARLISGDTIKRVVSYFLDLNYLDDEAWLQRFVEKLVQQGKSAREIFVKGRARGIATQTLAPLLQKVNSDSLKILVTKRYPVLLDKKSTFQQKQKAMGALYRKGFSVDDIRSISKYTHREDP